MSSHGRELGLNCHKGETCVVIGNGPSLSGVPLERLPYVTFGSNMIYRKPFTPTYYCVIDKKMAEACLPYPESFKPEVSFIRAEFAHLVDGKPIYPIVVNGFGLDPNNFIVMGGTVTYALLQLAFYMGFSTVLLVGVDHRYPNAGKLKPASRFVAGEKDPDHFECADGKPYFTEGKTFAAPEVDGTTRFYKIAADIYGQAGRKVINLTEGTHLNVFPKDKLEKWIRSE